MTYNPMLDPEWDGVIPKSKVKPKQKGSTFERRVAKYLSKWTGLEFMRVPGSGGHKWGKSEGFKGDVTAKGFPFVVECKNYQDSVAVVTQKGTLASTTNNAMRQALADALAVGKIPLVIRNYNHKMVAVFPIPPDHEDAFKAIGMEIFSGDKISLPAYNIINYGLIFDLQKYKLDWLTLWGILKKLYQ